MASSLPSLSLFLSLLCLAFFYPALAEIRFTEIRNDGRPFIPIDQFGFTHFGRLDLNVSNISLSDSKLDLSKVGFFLTTLDSWPVALRQLEDCEISCVLQSLLVKSVYTFNSLNTNDSFNKKYVPKNADQYYLVFANCYDQQLKISMDVRSAMYNLDGKRDIRDYLSAGKRSSE